MKRNEMLKLKSLKSGTNKKTNMFDLQIYPFESLSLYCKDNDKATETIQYLNHTGNGIKFKKH